MSAPDTSLSPPNYSLGLYNSCPRVFSRKSGYLEESRRCPEVQPKFSEFYTLFTVLQSLSVSFSCRRGLQSQTKCCSYVNTWCSGNCFALQHSIYLSVHAQKQMVSYAPVQLFVVAVEKCFWSVTTAWKIQAVVPTLWNTQPVQFSAHLSSIISSCEIKLSDTVALGMGRNSKSGLA